MALYLHHQGVLGPCKTPRPWGFPRLRKANRDKNDDGGDGDGDGDNEEDKDDEDEDESYA